jgi:hypothetical protein
VLTPTSGTCRTITVHHPHHHSTPSSSSPLPPSSPPSHSPTTPRCSGTADAQSIRSCWFWLGAASTSPADGHDQSCPGPTEPCRAIAQCPNPFPCQCHALTPRSTALASLPAASYPPSPPTSWTTTPAPQPARTCTKPCRPKPASATARPRNPDVAQLYLYAEPECAFVFGNPPISATFIRSRTSSTQTDCKRSGKSSDSTGSELHAASSWTPSRSSPPIPIYDDSDNTKFYLTTHCVVSLFQKRPRSSSLRPWAWLLLLSNPATAACPTPTPPPYPSAYKNNSATHLHWARGPPAWSCPSPSKCAKWPTSSPALSKRCCGSSPRASTPTKTPS